MKFFNSIVLLFLLLGNTMISAQTTVVSGLSFPSDVVRHNDNLYITQFGTDVLSKVDLTATTPSVVNIRTGLTNISGLEVSGDDLYFTQQVNTHSISKIDLTDTSYTPVLVLSGFNTVGSVRIYNNNLYFTDELGDQVYQVDLSDSTLSPTSLFTLDGAYDIAIKNNILYACGTISGKVLKYDLSSSTATPIEVTTVSSPVGIEFIGDDLYITSYSGRIYKVNINQSLPATATIEYSNLLFPEGMFFDGNDLFVVETNADRVFKLNFFAVSTEDFQSTPDWNVFPNPAQDVLHFKGLENQEKYQIFNTLGQLIQAGIANPSEAVSVDALSKGVYVLRLENGMFRQFVKQ